MAPPCDRETDGLRGPVKAVRTELSERRRSLGRRADTPRRLVETVAYTPDGWRLEWVVYRDGKLDRRYEYDYNEAGLRTQSRVTGPDECVLETSEYAYDDESRLVLDTITDARRHGVAYAHTWRRRGKRVEKLRERADGSPGRSESITYDRRGRPVEMWVYGADGRLDHKWVYGYDRDGRRTSEISYKADGSFRSKEVCAYNANGDEYKVAVYRPDGALSVKWAYTYAYDEAGNWVRRTIHLKSAGFGISRYRPVASEYRTIEYYGS
jgi:hypothetical protein